MRLEQRVARSVPKLENDISWSYPEDSLGFFGAAERISVIWYAAFGVY